MILPYFIIVPLLAAFLIALVPFKREMLAVTVALTAGVLLVPISLYSLFRIIPAREVYNVGGWAAPYGIVLVLDALSAFMLVMVSIIALTSLLFSVRYIRHLSRDWKYYALFMLLLAGMNGVIITGDLFNLFVFMEVALLSAISLVAYGGRAEEFEASFKYAVMGALSSTLILVGIAFTYSKASTLTMSGISDALTGDDQGFVLWVGALFLAGFGLKAAAMPFHAWLPDAHSSAPAPISSMLSGVFIKALGIYTLIRIFFTVLGAPPVFMTAFLVLGAVSIIVGVLLAIAQWDMKRLLAYHSISQIGYILLGMGLATPLGLLGAVFHLFNHAVFKSLLFYNAGAVEMALGTRDLKRMGNLRRVLPVTSGTSMVASLSIAGIPPFNGFFSKVIIIIAAVQAGEPFYAILAVIGSLLTLASFMKVQSYGFRGRREVEAVKAEIGWGMNAAMISLAVLCLLSSLLIVPGIRELTLDPVVEVILRDANSAGQLVMGR